MSYKNINNLVALKIELAKLNEKVHSIIQNLSKGEAEFKSIRKEINKLKEKYLSRWGAVLITLETTVIGVMTTRVASLLVIK